MVVELAHPTCGCGAWSGPGGWGAGRSNFGAVAPRLSTVSKGNGSRSRVFRPSRHAHFLTPRGRGGVANAAAVEWDSCILLWISSVTQESRAVRVNCDDARLVGDEAHARLNDLRPSRARFRAPRRAEKTFYLVHHIPVSSRACISIAPRTSPHSGSPYDCRARPFSVRSIVDQSVTPREAYKCMISVVGLVGIMTPARLSARQHRQLASGTFLATSGRLQAGRPA